MVKLFHAGLASPSILRSMLGVTPLAALNVMPSGGVSPANAREWWEAGAAVVGMGSHLVGGEIGSPAGSDAQAAAAAAWRATGRAVAQRVFDEAAARAAEITDQRAKQP